MMRYRIVTRTPETAYRNAGPWESGPLGPVTSEMRFETKAEAEAEIAHLRSCGPDWAAADYRAVPVRS